MVLFVVLPLFLLGAVQACMSVLMVMPGQVSMLISQQLRLQGKNQATFIYSLGGALLLLVVATLMEQLQGDAKRV